MDKESSNGSPRRLRTIRFSILTGVLLASAAFATKILVERGSPHHHPERKAWKDAALAAIRSDLEHGDYLKNKLTDPDTAWDPEGWYSADTILCRDGSWLACRSQCHKVDPNIHDIFVAFGSDGVWYYSDFHFCKGMMVLGMSGDQPESIADMASTYSLVAFDGTSDEALKPTRDQGHP